MWPEDIGLVVDWLEGWLVGPKRCNLSKSLDRAVASRCIVDTGQWTRQQLHSAEKSVSLCDDSDGDVVGEKDVDDVKRRTCPSSWFGCTRAVHPRNHFLLSLLLLSEFFSERHFRLSLFQSQLLPKNSFLSLRELLQRTAYISLLQHQQTLNHYLPVQ